jgi:hypothetical protein
VFSDQSNVFTGNQNINGELTATHVAADTLASNSASVSGSVTPTTSLVSIFDTGAAGGNAALFAASQSNVAGLFSSSGPTILVAGTPTHGVLSVTGSGVAVTGSLNATNFSGNGSALTNVSAATVGTLAASDIATATALTSETSARQSADASLQSNINSVSSASAQLVAANTFTAKQTLAASTTTSASLNVPAGSAPATPAAGDVWNTGSALQYRDNASTTRSLVSTTQSGGLQLLKLTASISPANVGSQACAEQSFTVTGISTGDVLLSVLQPSTSSPGTNIAIGGFRVSAANTVAVQFCNVSRNSSTPTAGVYTFALMR